MSLKLVINGCPLEMFEGAIVEDAVLKFSKKILKDVKKGEKEILDPDGNKYYLSGELTGGETFIIKNISPMEKKMKNSKFILIMAAILALAFIFLGSLFGRIEGKEIKITIFHLNDIHGRIDNMGKIASIVDSEREINPNVYLVQAGDNFSGNPVVDQYKPKGEPLLILMNKLKFNVGTIGNHDFDYGKKILKSFMERAEFPILCSNINSTDPGFPQPAPYTKLKTEDGFEIIFLGLIQREKQSRIPSTLPDNVSGLTFSEGTESAVKYKHLKQRDNLFIALSHLGIEGDKILAGKMGELDLIIGGHSHTLIEQPREENGVLITQAGANTSHLGRIDILVRDGKIVGKKGTVINLNEVSKTREDVELLVKDFNRNSPLNKVLTIIDTSINGRHNLGLMVTDAIREDLGLDMIFYNKGGIRINRLSGTITAKDVYAMHPFGNYIVEIRMDTSEIKDLIRNDYEGHRGIDIIPSGLSYRITRNLNKKVLDIDLFDMRGYKIPERRSFRVGINNYIVSSYKFRHKDPGRSTNAKTVDIIIRFFTNLKKKIDYSNIVRSEEKIIYTGNTKTLGRTLVDIFTSKKKFYKNSPSGNLISDAMKQRTRSDLAFYPTRLLKTEIKIKSGSEIFREALPDLYNFLKQSRVITVELTGEQVREFILTGSRRKDNIDLQISGGTYSIYYDINNHVRKIEFLPGNGSSPVQNRIYKVALIEYEYNKFYSLKNFITAQKVVKETLEEMISEYIRKTGTLSKSVSEKRIILVGDKKN